MEVQRELSKSFSQIIQETLRILPMLEAYNTIVAIAHDDHVAGCMALAVVRKHSVRRSARIGAAIMA